MNKGSKKEALLKYISVQIQEQIEELNREVISIQEEIGKETKSSAGDKFETAREMMNQERQRLEERMAILNDQRRAIELMKDQRASKEIDFGALVSTDRGDFLIGAAIGKVVFEERTVVVLSLNSPLGSAFKGKEKGQTFRFMEKEYTIKEIN